MRTEAIGSPYRNQERRSFDEQPAWSGIQRSVGPVRKKLPTKARSIQQLELELRSTD